MKLTKKRAKALSIKKWEWIVENTERYLKDSYVSDNLYPALIKAVPEVKNLHSKCGYCEYYIQQDNGDCESCPLNSCYPGSAYDKWCDFKTKESAQTVLDLIKKS